MDPIAAFYAFLLILSIILGGVLLVSMVAGSIRDIRAARYANSPAGRAEADREHAEWVRSLAE